jgi:hypothetical protein
MSVPNVNIRQGQSEVVKKPNGVEVKHWDGSQDAKVRPDIVKINPTLRGQVKGEDASRVPLNRKKSGRRRVVGPEVNQ